jgi:hypothetical protein
VTPHFFSAECLPVFTVYTDNRRTSCPGCGLSLPESYIDPPDRFNATGECWQLFSDLSCYSVAKQDAGFTTSTWWMHMQPNMLAGRREISPLLSA